MTAAERDAFDLRVLEAVRAGCQTNAAIRARLGLEQNRWEDPSVGVGESLQRLKKAGQVAVKGVRWSATSVVRLFVEVPADRASTLDLILAPIGGRVLRGER